ncbi:MAG TPA: lytic transglycosylase domain-containing protein [Thermoanaerobaculia bacterium]|nr:lytic transglycosylase domain-containing protein [Thermoanaerobaculia bacterium]
MRKKNKFANRGWSAPSDYRIICDCQRHRGRRSLAASLRSRMVLLIGGSVLLLGAGVPLDAFELTTPEPAAGVVRSSMSSSVPPAIQLADDLVSLGPAELPSPLMIETVRERFFRTEIPYGDIIYREAKRQGMEPELIAAVVKTESDFRPRLVSSKNAQGLMQLIPGTAELMGVSDVTNPVENVRGGVRYLRELQSQFDDPQLVLAAYNAGPGRVRTFGGIPPYRETRDYVRKVEKSRERYQKKVAERIALMTR